MEPSSHSSDPVGFDNNSPPSEVMPVKPASDRIADCFGANARSPRIFRRLPHPLKILAECALLFIFEGASLGLLVWELNADEVLFEYIHKNVISVADRRLLLLHMGTGASIPILAGLGYLFWKQKAALVPLKTASRCLAPLGLAAFLPVLFNWMLWQDHDLPYLAMVSLVAIIAQLAFYSCFSVISVSETSARLTARAMLEFERRSARFFRSVAPWLPIIIVAAFAVWYAVFFSYYTVLNHRSLRSASFDLGLENNIIWNTLHGGKLLISSPLGGPGCSHLGFHATFFSYVIALFYVLHQDPETLLVFQAVAIAAAAFPLFFYARRHIGPWAACLVSCAYLLYAPVHGSNLYDFHYPPLAALFLWSTLFFVESGRYKLAALAVLLSLSVREDVSVGVMIIGAFLVLTDRKPKSGFVLMCVGLAYFSAMKFFVMPRAAGGDSSFTYVYKNLLPAGESGFGGILKTVFGNPVFTLSTLLERDKLIYFLQIMAPLAFLPLRRSIGWLLVVPGFIFTLLSTGYSPVIQISFQYTAHWTVYLFIAVVAALAWLARPLYPGDHEGRIRKRAWLAAMALALLSNSYQHGALLQHNTVRGGFGRYNFVRSETDIKNYNALYSLIKKVPPLAKIASTEWIVPHVSSRPDSYTMRVGIFDAEYLLFPDSVGREEWIHFGPALKNGVYGIIDQVGPFFLAKRGAPIDRNKEVIRLIRR